MGLFLFAQVHYINPTSIFFHPLDITQEALGYSVAVFLVVVLHLIQRFDQFDVRTLLPSEL